MCSVPRFSINVAFLSAISTFLDSPTLPKQYPYHYTSFIMSTQAVRVAVTQAEPAWLDLAAGVAKTRELITEASKNGAKLIAFPECWIPGYPCWIW